MTESKYYILTGNKPSSWKLEVRFVLHRVVTDQEMEEHSKNELEKLWKQIEEKLLIIL